MPDRIDPMGGWFNQEDSRVVETPGAESAQMQPRIALKALIRKLHANAIIETVAPTAAIQIVRGGNLIQLACTAPPCLRNGVASIDLSGYPIGTTLKSFTINAWQKDNTTSASKTRVAVEVFLYENDDTVYFDSGVKNSTSNGAWVTDVFDISSSNVVLSDSRRVVVFFYFQEMAGDATGDTQLRYAEFALRLPG